jgi:hypothetical protein
MAGFVFNTGALRLQDGTIDWESATIRARLSETTETLNRDSSVMTGLGLSATDIAVTSRVGPVVDLANDRVAYQSDPLAFPAVADGPYVDKAIVFAFISDDASSIPIAVVTLSSQVRPNGGGILVDIDPAAMFYTQQ